MPKSGKPTSMKPPAPEPAAGSVVVQRKRQDLAQIQRWYANCEPNVEVVQGDRLYVELDDPEHRLRGEFRLDSLKQAIRFEPFGSCQLFSGFAGTGKSTTLRKLKSELEDDGYVVLMADACEYLDLDSQLEFVDLLVVLAGAFGDETKKLIGGGVRDTFWEELREMLESRFQLEGARFDSGAHDLQLCVRQGNAFWKKLRVRLAETPSAIQIKAHQFIAGCIARIRRHYHDSNRQVVFLFDSLEQLRANIVGFSAVMSSVVRVFKSHAAELRLSDCHVVYSVPPYLNLWALEIGGMYDRISPVLPAVRVESRVGRHPGQLAPHEDGIAALREVVDKRVPITEFFGSDLAPLDKLILASGGHLRTLIAWMRELLYVAESQGTPVDGQDVDQILKFSGRDVRQGVYAEQIPILAQISEQGEIEGLLDGNRARVAELVGRYFSLAYENGDGAYYIHPLVRDFVSQRQPPVGAGVFR